MGQNDARTPKVSNAILEQFRRVRDSGHCNMMDRQCIIQECLLYHGLDQLMDWLLDFPEDGLMTIIENLHETD